VAGTRRKGSLINHYPNNGEPSRLPIFLVTILRRGDDKLPVFVTIMAHLVPDLTANPRRYKV